MADYPSLDAWAHKRVVTIPLDDETQVDFRLPDLSVWLARGRIPNPLAAVAEALEYRGFDVAAASKDERRKFLDLQLFIIATHLVNPNPVDELGGEKEAIKWVEEFMPADHRMEIWKRCFHMLGPTELEGMLRSLGEMESFRDGAPGANGGGPSESIETTT